MNKFMIRRQAREKERKLEHDRHHKLVKREGEGSFHKVRPIFVKCKRRREIATMELEAAARRAQ